ncbi:unnamed protein product [Camellia sinensis]
MVTFVIMSVPARINQSLQNCQTIISDDCVMVLSASIKRTFTGGLLDNNRIKRHVIPLLKLSHKIADYGIKVTVVNTEFIHAKIMTSMLDHKDEELQNRVRLVSIPDGLGPGDDQRDGVEVMESIRRVMLGHLKDLIEKIGQSEEKMIRCVIADATLGWILEVAKEMGIEQAVVWPAGPGGLLLHPHIPKLIELGVLDMNVTVLRNELIILSKDIPAWSSTKFSWCNPSDLKLQKIFFENVLSINQSVELSTWLMCNPFYELNSPISQLVPKMLPVGPLLTSDEQRRSTGSLRLQDSTCWNWLDEQPIGCSNGASKRRIILWVNRLVDRWPYVAFGSTTVFSQHQFLELALGVELADLTNRSFAEYPDGFKEKVGGWGKIVEWAPQEKVLGHPAIACFFTHCGWNSTMEGVSSGVPFLCWPYFGDQFHNRSYICDVWKVGLRLEYDENKIVSRHEIKNKIEKLLSDDDMKANSLKLKEIARKSIEKGGSSCKNLERFVQNLKQ